MMTTMDDDRFRDDSVMGIRGFRNEWEGGWLKSSECISKRRGGPTNGSETEST